MIEEYDLTVTTSGSAGSATGNNTLTEPPNGLLVALYINAAGMPATTDWTFAYVNPAVTLFTLTNYNTSGWIAIHVPVRDLTGALTGSGLLMPINRVIKVSIAGADAGSPLIRFMIT